MHVAMLSYSSAIICVTTRGLLSVIDRSILQKKDSDISQIIFLNSVLPFLVGLLVTYTLYPTNSIFTFLFDIKILLNALGAQAAAIAFSHGFKNMTVRNLTAMSKVTDLFIPILIFIITKNFSLTDYLFSCLSVAIFIPIFYSINKDSKNFSLKSAIIIWLCLSFQAVINVIFDTHEIANTTERFMSFMCCILFWRVLFVAPIFYMKSIKKNNTIYKNYFRMLSARALLAFISQAAFFFSITRISSAAAWPMLNSGPLIACVVAHLFIKEDLKKPEYLTIFLFVPLSILYIIHTWSLL